MSYKTTQKEVKQGYNNVVYTGYCNLQHLLYYERAIAHTERAEGWGADIYDYGNTAIVTGYAPFGHIRADYETVKRYDEMARPIVCSNNMDYEIKIEMLSDMIQQFITEVLR